MPKIKKAPAAIFMNHLIERFRDGRIKAADFSALQNWLDTEPVVPKGEWYKRFPTFILAGEGEVVKTHSRRGYGSAWHGG